MPGNEVLIIDDTTLDVRFADNPLVLHDSCIRYYAGCPLKFLDGSRLGTLCIIDTSPGTLGEEEIIARFRRSLDMFNHETHCGYNISFSAGINAVDHQQDHSIGALMSRTDYLIYERKQDRP